MSEDRYHELNGQYQEVFGRDIPKTIGFPLEYYYTDDVLDRVEQAIKNKSENLQIADLEDNLTY